MVYLSKALTSLITAALLSQTITAHPGHDMESEIAERSAYFKNSARDLSHCNKKLKKRGTEDRQLKRRQTAVENLRQERGLHHKRKVDVRSLDSVTNTSHLSDLDVTSDTTSSGHWGVEDIIYSNSSCILSPEGEIGPFYVTGEFIRRDVRETQEGIDIIVDGQFIDVNTCEPIPNLMWDLWHANSSGVYGGVIGSGNGNEADTGNLNNTFLRGLQPTDGDGVAQFITKFPGHYAGRATHIHVVGHLNGTVLSNGTYTGGNIAHIGQLFFDQDLITEVNLLEPYVNNTIAITENVDDKVVVVEVDNDADPFFNYVLLGDTVSDGLFMWITLGVDPTAAYTYSAASEYTADGGIELSSSTSPDGNSTSNTTTAL